MRFMGEVDFPHTQEGYQAAQQQFVAEYYPLLNDRQRIVVGQLASAIVDGELGPKNTRDEVIRKTLEGCKQLGVSETIITAAQEFGETWADTLYSKR